MKRKKIIQHKIQYTVTVVQCRRGVEVSREKRPNEQKFKKGRGNLVFVLLLIMFQLQYYIIYMLVILPNVWYRCIYILGKVKTHTCARADTHNILYMHVRLQSCIPVNMETYPQKQLLYCLIMYTCMFLFRLKRSMLQKGKSKCFSWHSRDNISGAWSQIHPGKHCST